jgi:hypothetical protein
MNWKQQGKAVTAAVKLADGRMGTIVIVGPRSNARGAVVVAPKSGEEVDKLPFVEGASLLHPKDVVSILVMQERLHGDSGLSAPSAPPELAS